MNVKEIRAALMLGGTKFTVNDITMYAAGGGSQNYVLTPFVMNGSYDDRKISDAIGIDEDWNFKSMNVNKFGPTCVTFYSFDMFNKRMVGKIKYEDVNIVSMEIQDIEK